MDCITTPTPSVEKNRPRVLPSVKGTGLIHVLQRHTSEQSLQASQRRWPALPHPSDIQPMQQLHLSCQAPACQAQRTHLEHVSGQADRLAAHCSQRQRRALCLLIHLLSDLWNTQKTRRHTWQRTQPKKAAKQAPAHTHRAAASHKVTPQQPAPSAVGRQAGIPSAGSCRCSSC